MRPAIRSVRTILRTKDMAKKAVVNTPTLAGRAYNVTSMTPTAGMTNQLQLIRDAAKNGKYSPNAASHSASGRERTK